MPLQSHASNAKPNPSLLFTLLAFWRFKSGEPFSIGNNGVCEVRRWIAIAPSLISPRVGHGHAVSGLLRGVT